MFGDASLHLIDALKREKDNNKIAVYELEKTKQLCQETIELRQDLASQPGTFQRNSNVVNVLGELFNGVKERNIKILKLYHYQRLTKLKPFVVKEIEIPESVHLNLNEKETDFCDKYNEVILRFKSNTPKLLDLSTVIDSSSPLTPFVKVLVAVEGGIIRTEDGDIELKQGNKRLVRKGDPTINRLLKRGWIKQISKLGI
ncbi:4671_t:CDS:1 [Entrophospora sp. SA101]|nr:10086_t:CDS:1 [Entrophospora sp. SA101]CAJ0648648.1 9569_t:CDS:1 [Entrophospora sp. SA101]CAJ0748466.1 4671_t:CDS:1 [Entrophospora sp. SA101]CAJ0835496.1 8576_t:CDS:1 [Entrophospora sp. SA101]CAJ0840740.1 20218_t:CDS:1 [Entrophospora sp. SA101]